jgi:vancomycin resistance protein YoaR
MHSTLHPPSHRPTGRIRRTPLDFAAIFSGLLLLVILIAVIFGQFWHADRIFTGVSVDGAPISGLTRAAAVEKLRLHLATQPAPPISLTYGGEQWPLPTDQLRASADVLDAVNQAYLVGREGNFSRRLSEQLVAALRGVNITPAREFDVAQIRYAVDQVANSIRRPARPATQVGDVLAPGQPGMDVDVDATVDAVMAALESGDLDSPISVPLTAIPLLPPAEPVVVDSTTGTAVAAFAQPLLLRNAAYGLDMALDPGTLDEIVFSREPLRLDKDALAQQLTLWAEQIDIPARDARLRFNPTVGGVSVIQPSQAGRALDIEATVANIEAALLNGDDQAELVVTEVQPKVDDRNIASMGIKELVATGSTYFAGSSAARVHNIEVGAEKFDGVAVPPDEVFSFNEYVEDVSSANGFDDSLIIWGDRTAVGVGGGICQVSTTLFRSVFAAGLPLVERYNHGYVVSWYGEPGMDATIYTPTVDFRWKNDTGNYLLIEPVVDGAAGVITFNLYGTKPDREVIIADPVITNREPPPPPAYQVDESLAPGQQNQVEWPKEGMTATVERTIIENGETRTETLVSNYQPWRAVYLVAPGALMEDNGEGN